VRAQVALLAGGRGAVRERIVVEGTAGSAAEVCPGTVAPLELRFLDAGRPGQRAAPQAADKYGHGYVAVDIDGQGG